GGGDGAGFRPMLVLQVALVVVGVMECRFLDRKGEFPFSARGGSPPGFRWHLVVLVTGLKLT
ncbi:hypothetical protein MKW98_008543, partial [Papaver atlanticum]